MTTWDDYAPLREQRKGWISSVAVPVTDWLIGALAVQPGEVALDLAAGAGDAGFEIVKSAGGTVRLISSDISPATVEVARRTATGRGLVGVDFQTLDGQRLDLPSASVDAVICRWGYMLMSDPLAALRETARVLGAGGRVAFSVWGDPTRNPWTTIDAQICSQLGYVPAADPMEPGGMFSLADGAKLRGVVEQAGLAVQRLEPVAVMWPYDGTDDYIAVEIDRPGPRGDFFRRLPTSRRELAKHLAGELLEPFRDGDRYVVPGETLNILARKA